MFGMGRDSFLLFSCMCCGHDSFLCMSLFLEDSCGKDYLQSHNAFTRDRQILDSIIIANECLNSGIKTELSALCKVDIEKTYDLVNWDFLLYLLMCGFGEKWHNWIAYCISSERFFVLVNGTPLGFFSSSCGLRQGDLSSPLLLVIIMEYLSKIISAIVSEGFFSGFSVGSRNVSVLNISHA